MSTITEFSGKHEFLSNFFRCDITDPVSKITFKTSEHFFQARKTMDIQERIKISECATPGQAKRMGKTVKLRPDWEFAKKEVMLFILQLKFEQNPELKQKLIDTKDDFLIEGNNWHDTFWGKCYCEDCKGQGENILGKQLMKLRQEFIDEQKSIQ